MLRLNSTPFRIVIDVSERRLTVFRANRPVVRARVAVGKPGTETPRNDHFAIAELIRTHTPGAFLGPIVMPITGYSEKLNEFAGGNGRVAIHGTSLPELIGTAASHGCIRMHNSDIVRVARIARPGDPPQDPVLSPACPIRRWPTSASACASSAAPTCTAWSPPAATPWCSATPASRPATARRRPGVHRRRARPARAGESIELAVADAAAAGACWARSAS